MLSAQGLTAQISGSVLDQADAAIPGALVELVNEGTAARREVQTDADGNFVFPQLFRGSYRIAVTANGFRRHEEKNIALSASERLVLSGIRLQVGEVQQKIEVTGEGARVQTQSTERSGLLQFAQLQGLPARGRSVFDFVRLLPGVVDTAVRDAPGGSSGVNSMNVNGGRHGTMNVTLDGVSALDIGNMRGPLIDPALEAVGEVKVLMNGHQAEYGRSSGATISVSTRSGSREFHGSVAYFKKNEWMNANDFFNNSAGLRRPLFRYDYPTFTFGGPVLLPFTRFNRGRDRLFFFWANDRLPRESPTQLVQRTFPTALERDGNFSQSFDTNRQLIPVRDPLSRAPFANNVIPASRLDRNGQGLLKVFPLPNTVDPANTFNAWVQHTISTPRHQEILRLDLNLGAKTTFYARGIYGVEKNEGPFQTTLGSGSWPQLDVSFLTRKKAVSSTLIHTFSSSLVNEFNFGVTYNLSRNGPRNQQTLDRNDRVKLGLNIPQFNPQINPNNMLPQATFGGIPNAASLSVEQRWPYSGAFYTFVWWDNMTKVYRGHNLKAGIYVERDINDKVVVVGFNGAFDFSRNVNNPLDTNHPYANAALGSVNSYSEANRRPVGHGRFMNVEWFVQDNWRVNRRLTLDYGVRFYHIKPVFSMGDQLASFAPDDYRAAQAPRLIQPFRDAAGVRVGRHPVTGEIAPEVKIGTFAPGAGTPFQGMRVVQDQILRTPPIQLSPRFGFALDPFADGKTAIRGSFAVLPDVFRVDLVLDQLTQPPLVQTNTAFYTTIRDLLGSPLSLSPNDVRGFESTYSPPSMYNWSLGVQRNIGFGTVVDVAYVATVGRHLLQRRNLNALGYGKNFRPESIDPTVNRPYPPNFLRPYQGFADIQYIEFGGSSNYHSMQAQVNRRFSNSLMLGMSYTWSKWLTYGISDVDTDVLNPFLGIRSRHYGNAAGDRRHNFVLNWLYSLPKPSKYWNRAAIRTTLDDWEISGFVSLQSGGPLGLAYSLVNPVDLTGASGAGVDSRVDLVAQPNLPRSERTFARYINTDAVRAPSAANFGIGNAAKYPVVGPGINNFDVTLAKNLRIRDRHRFQLRGEFYNFFNHAQFSDLDRTARFDVQGRQVNTRFGQLISARSARRVQIALKYNF
jgi:hypothetical protein